MKAFNIISKVIEAGLLAVLAMMIFVLLKNCL